MSESDRFPADFPWGAATAAYQVHVDYATQRRTPRASARFLSRVIRSRGRALFEGQEGPGPPGSEADQ